MSGVDRNSRPLVLKIVTPHIKSPGSLGAAISYIARLNAEHIGKTPRVELLDEAGAPIVHADADVADARRQAARLVNDDWYPEHVLENRHGGSQRYAYHIVVSLRGDWDGVSAERLREAVRQVAYKQFAMQGHKLVLGVHEDTDDPHVHMIVCAHNHVTGKQLNFERRSGLLERLRESCREELEAVGIDVDVRLRRDKVLRTDPHLRLMDELEAEAPTWMTRFGPAAFARLYAREGARPDRSEKPEASEDVGANDPFGDPFTLMFLQAAAARDRFQQLVREAGQRRALRLLEHFPELFGEPRLEMAAANGSWRTQFLKQKPIFQNVASMGPKLPLPVDAAATRNYLASDAAIELGRLRSDRQAAGQGRADHSGGRSFE